MKIWTILWWLVNTYAILFLSHYIHVLTGAEQERILFSF